MIIVNALMEAICFCVGAIAATIFWMWVDNGD